MADLSIKILVYVAVIIVSAFSTLFNWFLALLFSGQKKVVPPISDPILLKSAVSLASEIREGKIKSEDVVKAYHARVKEVHPYINAVADERFEAALKEAREVDELVASGTKTPQQLLEEKPLLGVPFTVKLVISAKDMPCNSGSLYHKGAILLEDPDVVALMKNAGAICIATTNCPDFSLHFETYNKIYGWTSNPYDTSKSAGGSSGGEGALIGSGGSLVGIGNDLGGSIRHPSNFNGIFGHKPTIGLVSNYGMSYILPAKVDQLLSTGPMCRYAEDLILMMKVLSGAEGRNISFNRSVNFSKMTIYYMLDDGNPISEDVSQEIKAAVHKALNHFQSMYGTKVKEIRLKEMPNATRIFFHILLMTVLKDLKNILTKGKFEIHPKLEALKAMFGQSKMTLGPLLVFNARSIPFLYRKKDTPWIMDSLRKLQEDLDMYLDEDSVLFLPSFASTAHYHYGFFPSILSTGYMSIFNLLGMPVTQCPMGLSQNQLPLGFQIAAAKGQDPLSLACALEIEKAFGGWVPPNASSSSSSTT